MIALYVIGWFVIGYYGLYKYSQCEKISSAWDCRWYDWKRDLKFEGFDYMLCILFSFLGVFSIIVWMSVYFTAHNDIKNFKNWRKLEELKCLSIKEIRLKKLKRLNKLRWI